MPGEIVYEEDVDKQADERAKFTQDFIEQLHASLTERQLENPEQLQQVRAGYTFPYHLRSSAGLSGSSKAI